MELTLQLLTTQLQSFAEYLQRVGAEIFIEAFKTYGIKNLSVQQLRYLEMIETKPGVSPGELAKAFQVKKPTVSNIIMPLERYRLIKRQRSTTDKRVCFLYPTKRTIEVFQKRRNIYFKLANHIMNRLNESETNSLLILFNKILSQEEIQNE
jgi:DNA-binding MarR family transcriptional regulator